MGLFPMNVGGGGGKIVKGSVRVASNTQGQIDFGGIPKSFSIIGMTVSDSNAYETTQFDENFKSNYVVKSSVGMYTTEVAWTPASSYNVATSSRERMFYYVAVL